MAAIVDLLEKLGADSKSRAMSLAEYSSAVDSCALDAAARSAVMARDGDALSNAAGGRRGMFCGLLVPD